MTGPAAAADISQTDSRFNLGKFGGEASPTLRARYALWMLAQTLLFFRTLCPRRVRPILLRSFGATIGAGVVIREHVYVHAPWNLTLEDNVWVGRGVVVLNHAPIFVSHDVCISQEVMLCSSGHDAGSQHFCYKHKPIRIETGVWVGARATIFAGAHVPANTTVAGASVYRAERST